MLSRQHFQRVAEIVAGVDNPEDRAYLTFRFSRYFEEENPRFSRANFIAAVEKARSEAEGSI